MKSLAVKTSAKRLYFLDERLNDRGLLGGKGAGLCEMMSMGLPIPPGFVIATTVCEEFYEGGGRLPPGLMDSVFGAIRVIEEKTGKRFGDPSNPLLVSVRSGAAVSMPGMMDTILNLGLNDDAAVGLAKQTANPRFAWDTYRRFIQLFGKVVLGIDDDEFSKILEEERARRRAKQDSELDAESMRRLTQRFKELCRRQVKPLPDDPGEQLERAIE